MRHAVARSLLGTLVLLLASHRHGGAQDVSRMDRIIQSHVDNKQFMGSVLVAQGGKVVLNKGYGSANLEWDIPDSPQTKFRLGSLTKQFTAAAILLLEERGKLKTDDLVAKYLPDAPASWAKITLANLLTHTSGIPNFTSFPDYSTTEDLWRWEQGLFGGTVLTTASVKKMTAPFKNDYAYGLAARTAHGYTVLEHGGGIEGFNTQLAYDPDGKLAVIVLGNLNGAAPGEIAGQLMSLLHGETVVLPFERKEITVSTDVLRQYVGTYQLTPTFSIVITLEGNRLMSQATNQSALPLFPESETSFFLKAVDAQIEFAKNDKGEVTSLTLRQGGNEMKASKR